MSRQKLENRNIRKLTRAGGVCFCVTLPIEMMRKLKWKFRQSVIVKRQGNHIIITLKRE